jgi:hypothetical protein
VVSLELNRILLGTAVPQAAASQSNRTSHSSISQMDDPGLDGFVHMNMIDDLLTE